MFPFYTPFVYHFQPHAIKWMINNTPKPPSGSFQIYLHIAVTLWKHRKHNLSNNSESNNGFEPNGKRRSLSGCFTSSSSSFYSRRQLSRLPRELMGSGHEIRDDDASRLAACACVALLLFIKSEHQPLQSGELLVICADNTTNRSLEKEVHKSTRSNRCIRVNMQICKLAITTDYPKFAYLPASSTHLQLNSINVTGNMMRDSTSIFFDTSLYFASHLRTR
jgi:hypothetical protein